VTAPAGLVAEQFAVDGVEFVAFTWDSPRDVSTLTPAERAVFDMLLQGASNAAIARARAGSVRTVANQVASIFQKLGVGSRYELIARFGQLASP
jgi:DNA-binding CsgD family transcriptional regulator